MPLAFRPLADIFPGTGSGFVRGFVSAQGYLFFNGTSSRSTGAANEVKQSIWKIAESLADAVNIRDSSQRSAASPGLGDSLIFLDAAADKQGWLRLMTYEIETNTVRSLPILEKSYYIRDNIIEQHLLPSSSGSKFYYCGFTEDGLFAIFKSDGTASGTEIIFSSNSQPFLAQKSDHGFILRADRLGGISMASDNGNIEIPLGLDPPTGPTSEVEGKQFIIADYYTGLAPEARAIEEVERSYYADNQRFLPNILLKGQWHSSPTGKTFLIGGYNYSDRPWAESPQGLAIYEIQQSNDFTKRMSSTLGPGGEAVASDYSLSRVAIMPSETGTVEIVGERDGFVYFTIHTTSDSTKKYDLFSFNLSTTGISRILELDPASIGRDIQIVSGEDSSHTYFAASTPLNGSELWETLGTPDTTHLVEDLIKGPTGSDPSDLYFFKGRLYYAAEDPIYGRELRYISPTDQFSTVVDLSKDFPVQERQDDGSLRLIHNSGSSPSDLSSRKDSLYFSASTQSMGREPWIMEVKKDDATESGLVLPSIRLDYTPVIPLVSLAFVNNPGDQAAFREGKSIDFKIVRSDGDPSLPFSVGWAITSIAAEPGDFGLNSLPTGTVRFDANENYKQISIEVPEDSIPEDPEPIELILTDPQSAVLSVQPPLSAVLLDAGSYSIKLKTHESLSEAISSPVELILSRSDYGSSESLIWKVYGSGPSPTDSTDFTGIPPGLSESGLSADFGKGIAEISRFLFLNNDATSESVEEFTIELLSASGQSLAKTSFSLEDDDNAQVPSVIDLAVSQPSVYEDSESSLVYDFSRTGDISSELTINYTVAGSANISPSGSDQADYSGIPASLDTKSVTFAADSAGAKVIVSPIGDTKMEPNETVRLRLEQGAGYVIGEASEATGTILNDDLIGTSRNDIIAGTAVSEFLNGKRGRDTLSGGGPAADTFGFAFAESQINAPDRITDFQLGTDKLCILTASGLKLPAPVGLSSVSNGKAKTFRALVSAAFLDCNGALEGKQALGANSAVIVKSLHKSISGTYLVVNDGVSALNYANDLMINITGFTGDQAVSGSIPMSSIFL